MSQKKEPHFFSHPHSEARLASYLSLFEGAGEYPVRGESSTSYMVVPEAPQRMRRVLGDPKLLLILRNPVDRALSHYRWLCGSGLEYRSFRRAFNADRDEVPSIQNTIFNSGNFRYYYQYSAYGSSVERFLREFDRDRLLIVTLERLVSDFDGLVRECESFLGLPVATPISPRHSNQTRRQDRWEAALGYAYRAAVHRHPRLRSWSALYWRPLQVLLWLRRLAVAPSRRNWHPSEADRAWLVQELKDEVAKLRGLTGLEFAEWGESFPA